MIRARFRLHLPPSVWVAEVSQAFPDATFRLLTGVPTGERSLELGEVLGEDPTAAVDAMAAHADVVALDRLFAGDGRALVRYETADRSLYDFLGERDLPPEFPLVVADGVMTFGITATRAQFDALGEALEASDMQYELRSVVHGGADEDVLTARQRECLAVAFREGYYEVPRECSLADVAAALDVDPSTASETLRRGAGRVLEWYLVDTE